MSSTDDATLSIAGGTAVNTAVVSTDSRYAPAAAVAVRSLIDSYQDPVPLEVVIAFYDDDHGATMRLMSASFAQDRVSIIDTAEIVPTDLPQQSYFGASAVYVRLLLDEVLPNQSRALYIDADTLTIANVADVWRTDLQSRPLAAVVEMFAPTIGHPDALWNAHELDLSPDLPYFNSGVLLVDLDQWRAEGRGGQCLDYIREFGSLCRYPDQDALNYVLADNWTPLDPSYNCSPFWDRPKYNVDDFGDVLARARILHFVGESKPWHEDYAHLDRRTRFLDVHRRTAFAAA